MIFARFLCACAILSGAVESFQPHATRHLSLLNESRCKRPASHLYNFLDDYKNNVDEEGGLSESGDFPPSICPQEIHRIRFSTTAGDFTIRLDLALSPSGVTRFLELVDDGFFNDQLIYRVDPGFVIQFGVASSPDMQSRWDPQVGAPIAPLPDEPNRQHFKAGTVSFAGSGVDSRSCHVFIALGEGLGGAAHETALGNIEEEDGSMIAIENIVRNREESGYGILLDMQEALIREGNNALHEYQGVDRIIACGRL